MSKYKVGDKFVIEIDKVLADKDLPWDDNELFRIKGFKSLVFDEFGLDKLEKYEENPNSYDYGYNKGYKDGQEAGMREAWELIKKIITAMDLQKIFGFSKRASTYVMIKKIISDKTIHEVKAKIEAWEKAQEEIKVGDVCEYKCVTGNVCSSVCVRIEGDAGYFLYIDGSVSNKKESLSDWKKTGRHIDIQSVLEQIGGKE